MFRTPAKRAMALVVTGAFALGAAPALANAQLIYQSSSTKKHQETRLVTTPQTEEVRGEKQFVGTTPHVEEQVTGPASKLVTESEIRSYQVPVTTHPLRREESREITTTTTNYIRRTSTNVSYQYRDGWNVGGYLRKGFPIGTELLSLTYRSGNDYKDFPTYATNTGMFTKSQSAYDQANSLIVNIYPHGSHGYLDAFMIFRKHDLSFVGGNIICHESKHANIKEARIIRHADYDEIQYRLNCYLNEDWWPWTSCETDRTVWTLPLDRKILAHRYLSDTRTETWDEPYQTVSDSAGPWTATGRMDRGPALTNPGLRYESLTEKVLLRRYQAVNDAVAPKQLATSGNDVRKTFTADKSSGKDQAVLSGSKLRQGLGANRVAPSRVAPKGAGAPVLPLGPLGGQSGKSDASPGRPQPTPKPGSISWWFPRDPQTPPPSVRYASYVSGL